MQTLKMTKPVTEVREGDRLLVPWTWFRGLSPQEVPPRLDEFRVLMWPVEVRGIGAPYSSSRVLQVRNVINGQALSTEVRVWWELCLYTNDIVRDALYRYMSAPASGVQPGDRFFWQDQLLEVVSAGFQGTPEGGPEAQVQLRLAAVGGAGFQCRKRRAGGSLRDGGAVRHARSTRLPPAGEGVMYVVSSK